MRPYSVAHPQYLLSPGLGWTVIFYRPVCIHRWLIPYRGRCVQNGPSKKILWLWLSRLHLKLWVECHERRCVWMKGVIWRYFCLRFKFLYYINIFPTFLRQFWEDFCFRKLHLLKTPFRVCSLRIKKFQAKNICDMVMLLMYHCKIFLVFSNVD